MKLTIGEKLMILRFRSGLSAKALGKAAFPHLDHPNVKISRIESGWTDPKAADIKTILEVLPPEAAAALKAHVTINIEVLKAVPELEPYINLINQAADTNDIELIRSTMLSFAKKIINNNNDYIVNKTPKSV